MIKQIASQMSEASTDAISETQSGYDLVKQLLNPFNLFEEEIESFHETIFFCRTDHCLI